MHRNADMEDSALMQRQSIIKSLQLMLIAGCLASERGGPALQDGVTGLLSLSTEDRGHLNICNVSNCTEKGNCKLLMTMLEWLQRCLVK